MRSISYQNQAMHALRSFFRFLKTEGYVAQDVAEALRLSRTPHTLPETVLTPEEARKVIETPDTSCLLGHRDLSTTERYLHLTIADLKETHRQFHPREQGVES